MYRLDMNVGYLRKLIADMPDDALVLVEGRHGSTLEARAREGLATEPNSQGFTSFCEDAPNESYIHKAIYFYRPM